MDQSELNGIVHKWLEGLQQLQNPEQKSDFAHLPVEGDQELTSVLEKLGSAMKITSPLKTSLHAGGTHLAILARSLSCYLSVALEQKDTDYIAGLLHTHVATNICGLIGLDTTDNPYATLYHDDVREGFVRAFQMALFRKYEDFAINGLLCAATKPPVIYVSQRGEIKLIQQACIRIGLPQSCVKQVACSSLHGSTHTIDTEALEKQINEDCNNGHTPLLVVACAGTPLAGHVDDLVSIKSLCVQYDLWLHVNGHGLSSLFLPEERKEINGIADVDSFTLYPATWFGILSSCKITLHKHPKVIDLQELPNSTNFPGNTVELTSQDFPIPNTTWYGLYNQGLAKFLSLPLWISFQYLGTSALIDTITYCRNLTRNMMMRLDDIPGMTRLAVPSHTSYVVLFKYNGGGQLVVPLSLKKLLRPKEPEPRPPEDVDKSDTSSSDREDKKDQDDEPLVVTIHGMPLVLTNMLNMTLTKELHQLFPKVGIATYDMGGRDGVIFRFDPITSFPEHSTSVEDIEKFAEELKAKVDTLHPVAQARCLFELALRNQTNLRWLEFPNVHCVAIIQYVRSDYLEKQELTVEEVNTLNKLNIELSQHLNSFTSVFRSFQHGNFTCLIISELPKDMTMFALLEMLLVETVNFEKKKEELLGLEEKIMQGIIAAQEDLTKEKEKFEEEEGLLKYVPIVGSVVNWFYPTSPTGITGRIFDLSSGKVETSSKVYQKRMQLIEEETQQMKESKEQEMVAPSTPVQQNNSSETHSQSDDNSK